MGKKLQLSNTSIHYYLVPNLCLKIKILYHMTANYVKTDMRMHIYTYNIMKLYVLVECVYMLIIQA